MSSGMIFIEYYSLSSLLRVINTQQKDTCKHHQHQRDQDQNEAEKECCNDQIQPPTYLPAFLQPKKGMKATHQVLMVMMMLLI